jgi:prophage regulatory protein
MSQPHTAPQALPASGFLREKQLVPGIVPFSTSTLWRQVGAGRFPAPVKLSARVTAWRVEDVRAWMEARRHGIA